MKKILAALTATFMLCSAFCAPKSPVLEPIEFDVVQDEGENVTFIIDPRIETIGMICRLAGMSGFTGYYNGDNDFLNQMDTIFSKYKDHKTVKTAKSLMKKGIDASAMVSLAYAIKPDFSGMIVELSPYPETLYYTWKKISVRAIYDFVKQVHDFAVETNFPRIYVLNKSSYIANAGYFKSDFEKTEFTQWAAEFFSNDEVHDPIITISRLVAGYNFYDFALSEEGKRLSYVTTHPGTSYYSLENCYINLYVQLFASKYWEQVKDNFIKFDLDYAAKYTPEALMELKKTQYSDYNLTIILSTFCWAEFLREKSPENHPSYEEFKGSMEKQIGEDGLTDIFDLIADYADSRDKYPTFDDYGPRIVEFINSLEVK